MPTVSGRAIELNAKYGECRLAVPTSQDRRELAALYFAAFPNTSEAALANDLSEENLKAWVVCRNRDGKLIMATMQLSGGTALMALVDPKHYESEEAEYAFMVLTEYGREFLRENSSAYLPVWFPETLEKFGAMLERCGLISSVTWRARYLLPLSGAEDFERPSAPSYEPTEVRKN